MRIPLAPALLLLSIAATSLPAAAQDIAGKAKEAEGLLARGRVIEAIDALDAAAAALWDRAPLAFRRGIWVMEKADGFGIFRPRPNNVFSTGQPMLVYAEPVGFGWTQNGEIYTTNFAADVVFRDKAGKELFRKDEFQEFKLSSRFRNREFMCNFTYTLTGLPAGEYTVETTLRDRVSGKKGSFTLPFTIK
jgi:hypothetical protein